MRRLIGRHVDMSLTTALQAAITVAIPRACPFMPDMQFDVGVSDHVSKNTPDCIGETVLI
jgi:hypothetical protein